MTRALLALAATAALTACIGTADPPEAFDYGLINITTTGTEGAYTTAPVGLFVHGNFQIPTTRDRNLCDVVPYSPGGQVTNLDYVDAGAEIAVSLGGTNTALVQRTDANVTSYVLPGSGNSISFTPGDVASFTIPGASGGFPAAEISVRTAEPFTMQPISSAGTGEDLPLSWSAAPAPGSVFVISLRYARAPSATQNEQIYCEAVDDGSFNVPGDLTYGWIDDATKLRSALATRYRSTQKSVGTDYLQAAAIFNLAPTIQ